jgi:hypothetical protein
MSSAATTLTVNEGSDYNVPVSQPGIGAMKTTADFLDDLQRKFDLPSDYAVGNMLGMHRQQISHYRLLKGAFDDSVCLKVAELLELDPGYVMACMHAQRAKGKDVKRAWERAAKSLAGSALAVLAGAAVALAPLPYAVPEASATPMYIMLSALLLIITGMRLASPFRHE